MATILPDFSYPQDLQQEQANYLRAVRGPGLSTMASQVNHLLGWRARRAVHKIIDWDRDQTAAHGGNVIFQDTDSVGHTTYTWWKSHELAKYVAVWFRYQTHDEGSAPNLDVQATLSVKGGAVIDSAGGGPGVQWVVNAGLDRLKWNGRRDGSANQLPQPYYPISFASTGLLIDEDNDAALDPDRPRPLVVGSNGGSWLELKLVAQGVRILSVDVWEIATPSVVI